MSKTELLDAVMGTPSKVKLIRALLSAEEPISGREAARRAGVSQRPAHRSLQDLVARGVVRKEVGENSHLFELNREHQLVRAGIIPLFEAEVGHTQTVKHALEAALRSMLRGSMPDLRNATLLTGRAHGDAPGMDLVLVGRNREAAASAFQVLATTVSQLEDRFGLQISVLPLTAEELRSRHEAGDEVVMGAATKGELIGGRTLREILDAEGARLSPLLVGNRPRRSWIPRSLL